MSHLFTRNSSGPCGFTLAFARLKNAKKIACYTVYIFNRARLKRLGGTPLPLSFRGGASHGTLVSLHLPLLGFFFIFFVCVFLCVCVCVCVCMCVCVCVCVCVLYYKFILYITRGAPNKAVEKKNFPGDSGNM